MYLISFGTRPELIKLIPLILKFKEKQFPFITLFTGQHETLIQDFIQFIDKVDIHFNNIMEPGQSLNKLVSKIMVQMDNVFNTHTNIKGVIVHGDTSSAYAIALSSFHHQIKVIHLEAGLRTGNKYSPFPEEMNRKLISQITDIHLCPTINAVENLKNENITDNVYNVGNTIVDMYEYMKNKEIVPQDMLQKTTNPYYLVTLHRRENRGEKMKSMWNQLNKLSDNHNFIYISHPSLPQSKEILNKKITILEPQNYTNMVFLINNSHGIITDSGGIQEEAVCAGKKVLICRNTTERPETIESGLGKLVNTNIVENIDFLNNNFIVDKNPFGCNVVDKICEILPKQYININE